MNLCPDCANPLDEAGFTNCPQRPGCSRDRATFKAEVERIKTETSLPALASMEANSMPECFVPTRAAIVALAGMMMEALRQNQTMAELLRTLRQEVGDKLH